MVNGATWTEGKYRKALKFDGTDDYVRVPGSDDFVFGANDFTVEMWVNPAALEGDWRVLLADSPMDNFQVALSNGGTAAWIGFWGGGTRTQTPSLSWTLGQWYHIAVTRSNGAVIICRDGLPVGSGTNTNDVGNNTAIDIGYRASTGQHPWNGTIDDVKIYNRTLSTAEIWTEYKLESTRYRIATQITTVHRWSTLTSTYVWNTTDAPKSNYTVIAVIEQVPGETDTSDNLLVDGTIYVGTPGNVDGNSIVNMLDLYYVSLNFGRNAPYASYAIANCDIDNNGIVNMLDLYIAAIHFGQTDP